MKRLTINNVTKKDILNLHESYEDLMSFDQIIENLEENNIEINKKELLDKIISLVGLTAFKQVYNKTSLSCYKIYRLNLQTNTWLDYSEFKKHYKSNIELIDEHQNNLKSKPRFYIDNNYFITEHPKEQHPIGTEIQILLGDYCNWYRIIGYYNKFIILTELHLR